MKYKLLLPIIAIIFTSKVFAANPVEQTERLTSIVSALHRETLSLVPSNSNTSKFDFNFSLAIIPDFDRSVGTKEEGELTSPVIPKPSLRYSYALFFLELGGNPTVSAFDVETRNTSLKIGTGITDSLSIWAGFNEGQLNGNITDADASIPDELTYSSTSANLTYAYIDESFRPYITIGYGKFNSEIEVKSDGSTTDAEFDGLTYELGINFKLSSLSLNAEIAGVGGLLFSPRVGLSYTF